VKPRLKLLDGIMTKVYTKLSYSELKSTAQDQTKWRHHNQNLPIHQASGDPTLEQGTQSQ